MSLRILLDCSEVDPRTIIQASHTELATVLSNVVNNAVDSIGKEKGRISLTAKTSDAKCIIGIEDSGEGMCSEFVQKLGSARLSTKGFERGIGLTHAFQTIQSLNGEIELQSEQHVGTRVLIKLPRHLPTTEAHQNLISISRAFPAAELS